jgi:hypothetical protein
MRESISGDHCHFRMNLRAVHVDRDGGTVRVTVESAPATWRAGSDQLGGENGVPPTPPAAAGIACGEVSHVQR